jgi:hypothetical protein
LFADEEVVLRFAIGRKREYPVPTRDARAIETALARPDGA